MTPEERYSKFDARLELVAMNLELTVSMAQAAEARMEKRIEQLRTAAEKNTENIRALARIAKTHEHRPSDLEGGEPKN